MEVFQDLMNRELFSLDPDVKRLSDAIKLTYRILLQYGHWRPEVTPKNNGKRK